VETYMHKHRRTSRHGGGSGADGQAEAVPYVGSMPTAGLKPPKENVMIAIG